MKLSELLQTNILSVLPDNIFQCKCGSILKKSSISSHLKSKKHQKYCERKECPICMENPDVARYTCRQCKNEHCMECHPNMTKCPFCRKEFQSTRNVQTEHFFWTEIITRLDWVMFCIQHGIDNYMSEYEFIRRHEHHVSRWFHAFPVFLQDLQNLTQNIFLPHQ